MFNKFLSCFVIVVLAISFFSGGNIETVKAKTSSSDRYFIVTAYYSPLPNQKKYIMGNYQAEIRMNGRGIRGASGRKVFSGMLAAPGKYGFGTKIYLEGLGVGEVSDRGGAIVQAGERNFKHDRIDLWVGHGEEGLQRAMYWGNRTIKGSILNHHSKNTINVFSLPAPKWTTSRLKTNPFHISNAPDFFHYGIGTKSNPKNIKKLQRFLREIGLYHGAIDGKYKMAIINTIYNFQKKHNLISDWSDIYAGYWSQKTRVLFWKQYKNGAFAKKNIKIVPEIKTESIKKEPLQLVATTNHTIQPKTFNSESIFDGPIHNSEGVKILQQKLSDLGLYTSKADGQYSSIREVILNFQLTHSIISQKTDIGAGNYGPKTRRTLQQVYKKHLEQKIKKEEERKIKEEKQKKAQAKIDSLGNIRFGETSPQVREFQKILIELGFLKVKDTAYFGIKTKNALIEYQKSKGLVQNSRSIGAGIFGSNTKKNLIQDLSK